MSKGGNLLCFAGPERPPFHVTEVGAEGVRSVRSDPFGFNVLVLVVWHFLQDLQNASTSLAMLGHQYQRARQSRVFLAAL